VRSRGQRLILAACCFSIGCAGGCQFPPRAADASATPDADSPDAIPEDADLDAEADVDADTDLADASNDADHALPPDADGDHDLPPGCDDATCSGHGLCDDATGAIECDCELGYEGDRCETCSGGFQDNDLDGECSPTCETAGLLCRTGRHCDDSTGSLACACDEGLQDNDGDGACEPTCEAAALDCGVTGVCDDSSGWARCACFDGYQDHDGDGACAPACDGLPPPCGGHGACDDASGAIECACDEGYLGESCERCRAGYQDNDGDGECLMDCRTALLACPDRSHCDDGSGTPACVCDEGYSGIDCGTCAAGFQDNDGDGLCLPTCATALVLCLGPGGCDDSSGLARCRCDEGFQDHDDDRSCLPDCTTAALECAAPSVCDDASGVAACVCTAGFQDNDGDGACLPDCETAALVCGPHRACDDSSGAALCACARGYDGDDCDACAAGFEPVVGGCGPDHAWAVLVYLDADNDLEPYALDDLTEMTDAGSTGEVHVVALLDTLSGGAVAYYVEPGLARAVADWGEPDMGDWRTLRDFGVWAAALYPARHTAVVLWDHGAGWKSSPAGASAGTRAFAWDAHGSAAGISISGGDYARALEPIVDALGGQRLALVGFDACLMGSWEVAAATAPFADLLVASSEVEPLEGWSYRVPLRHLGADPAMSPEDFGAELVEAYHAASPLHFTMAAVDLAAMGRVGEASSGLADRLAALPSLAADLDAARLAAQGFDDPDARDLWDLAEQIASAPGAPPELVAAADTLVAELSVAIVGALAQPSHPGAHGLSIHLPSPGSGLDPAYRGPGATWSAETTWDELLLSFAGP
jgi:hypothetical protein